MKELPIYELLIDNENDGMFGMALVKHPAMKTQWLAFADEEQLRFSIADEEEHKILSVIARPDFPIYRISENKEEFYAVFSRKTIEIMSQKFLADGYQGLVNVEHNEELQLDGVNLEQIFIKNTDMGICPKGFENIEEGTLFGIYKIENEDVWAAIKEGVFTGLSLEGMFKIQPIPMEIESEKAITIDDLLDMFK